MKKNLFTGLLIIPMSLYSFSNILAAQIQNTKLLAREETVVNNTARASPGDTARYSIQMKGKKNTLIVNGQVMVSTPDTTEKQNNIRVRGEENTITIHQTDRRSEVNISQKGNKNQITISQKKVVLKKTF